MGNPIPYPYADGNNTPVPTAPGAVTSRNYTITRGDAGIRPAGKQFKPPSAIASFPAGKEGYSFPAAVFENMFGQLSIDPELKKRGFPRAKTAEDGSSFYGAQKVRYPAKPFSDYGLFNGFPFLIEEPSLSNISYEPLEVHTEPEGFAPVQHFTSSGIASRSTNHQYVANADDSVLGGGWSLEENNNYYNPNSEDAPLGVASHNYWNLACIETSFAIRTISMPDGYVTGYCVNPDADSEESIQLVTEDFEVVDSYSQKSFPPHLRQFQDRPKYDEDFETNFESQILDENNLIMGSGRDYSSISFWGNNTGFADFVVPITIQPENTGAFVITTDLNVANYFENLDSYGSKKAFACNMVFDYSLNTHDEEGFERQNIEYHITPQKAYIVPAEGWDFEVICSKVKGIYYQYPFDSEARFDGDQSSFLNHQPSITPCTFGLRACSPQQSDSHDAGLPYHFGFDSVKLTHCPLEPAPTQINQNGNETFYGSIFEKKEKISFLINSFSTQGEDNVHRQSFSETGLFETSGTPGQYRKFAIVAPRPELEVDEDVLIDHLTNESYLTDQHEQDHVGLKYADAYDICMYSPSQFAATHSTNNEVNPRNTKDATMRPERQIGATIDRTIPIKTNNVISESSYASAKGVGEYVIPSLYASPNPETPEVKRFQAGQLPAGKSFA